MKWWANAFVIRTPEGEEVNKGTKTKFERKMTENISKLTKKKKKSSYSFIPNRMSTMKTTPKHILIKLLSPGGLHNQFLLHERLSAIIHVCTWE